MKSRNALRWISPFVFLLGNLNFSCAQNKPIHIQPGSLNFLVVGDWGRNGAYHQKETADEMEKIASQYDIQFIVSTGDNIYEEGVKGVYDEKWKSSFENIYTGAHLQKPWYCVLGNHDYKGLVDAEIGYSQHSNRWNMPARYFTKKVKIENQDSVLLAFLDTNPFISSYRNTHGKYGDVDRQDTSLQLKWLDSVLNHSHDSFKLVFGHHPVYSAGTGHGNSPDLIKQLNPLLIKNGVDFYICGHDHDLQHLKKSTGSLDYIVSGAGSETRIAGFIPGMSLFSNGDSGFALISLSKNNARVYFINYKGEILYSYEKNR